MRNADTPIASYAETVYTAEINALLFKNWSLSGHVIYHDS